MQQYKKDFIEFMVECGVLTFGDFVTKSGRKTPFFVNTGNYKTGSQLKRLGEFYARAIKENFKEDYNIVFGPAYKGIPLSVTTTIALSDMYGIDVNYCSNRKEVKDHGDKGILLGSSINDGDKVLIVEDVTTAGTSIYETMPILKSQGNVDVEGLIISVDRMERGKTEKSALTQIREEFGFKTCAIVTMAEVREYLYNKEINGKILIDDEINKRIDAYYEQYGAKEI
ncbi:MAG: orotate phosphoribosyltransferase [Clostridium sp.]|jgi:orotate phosphoribosyltransferase|nr:orotate phosphoribosyltransferase [Clostridium sp.]